MKTKVTIFCDGACSPNPGIGGWGAVLIDERSGIRREISGGESDTTNNRMELIAAIRALEALKRPCEVAIYTDSQYVHNAFTEGWLAKWQANGWRTSDKKPVSNDDLWRRLIELGAVHAVKWHWVRGHADNDGNNRADQLAVSAREEIARLKAKDGSR